MRYFTCLLVALCISASTIYATDPNGRRCSSEKQQVNKQETPDSEADALYLKGRSYWNKRTLSDLETAVSCEDIPKAKAAVRKALELNANLARPHAALGYIKMVHEWDLPEGRPSSRRP